MENPALVLEIIILFVIIAVEVSFKVVMNRKMNRLINKKDKINKKRKRKIMISIFGIKIMSGKHYNEINGIKRDVNNIKMDIVEIKTILNERTSKRSK